MEHPDVWLWKCLKLHIYLPTPKGSHQQGLNKLLLTFLDDAIDKNRLVIWSTRANLSCVLAHLKWIFHFLPDAGVRSRQGLYLSVLMLPCCVPGQALRGSHDVVRIDSVMKTEFWRFSWFTMKDITFLTSYFSCWMVNKRNRISSMAWAAITKIQETTTYFSILYKPPQLC